MMRTGHWRGRGKGGTAAQDGEPPFIPGDTVQGRTGFSLRAICQCLLLKSTTSFSECRSNAFSPQIPNVMTCMNSTIHALQRSDGQGQLCALFRHFLPGFSLTKTPGGAPGSGLQDRVTWFHLFHALWGKDHQHARFFPMGKLRHSSRESLGPSHSGRKWQKRDTRLWV